LPDDPATNPSNLGDVDALTFGARFYPFMHSRDGFAIHPEYSILRTRGAFTDPNDGSLKDLTTSSLFLGVDFIF